MINDVLLMELVVSLVLSFAVLGFFVWGSRTGQFDDSKRMMDGLLFDSQEDLNEAIKREDKMKDAKENKKKGDSQND